MLHQTASPDFMGHSAISYAGFHRRPGHYDQVPRFLLSAFPGAVSNHQDQAGGFGWIRMAYMCRKSPLVTHTMYSWYSLSSVQQPSSPQTLSGWSCNRRQASCLENPASSTSWKLPATISLRALLLAKVNSGHSCTAGRRCGSDP